MVGHRTRHRRAAHPSGRHRRDRQRDHRAHQDLAQCPRSPGAAARAGDTQGDALGTPAQAPGGGPTTHRRRPVAVTHRWDVPVREYSREFAAQRTATWLEAITLGKLVRSLTNRSVQRDWAETAGFHPFGGGVKQSDVWATVRTGRVPVSARHSRHRPATRRLESGHLLGSTRRRAEWGGTSAALRADSGASARGIQDSR